MTIREYITEKFQSYGVTEANIVDLVVESGLNADDEYTASNATSVGKAMCSLIQELALAPFQKSISESGFSMSWDYTKIGNYYLWLCRKYGIKPDEDTLAALGVNAIIDRTSKW